jgi:F-box-like
VTINVLPDDVLVEIFFYVNTWDWNRHNPWHALVHVCRRWRYLVFASPRHLNLQLEYSGHRPMSEVLDVWPVLPIRVAPNDSERFQPKLDQWWDNRVVALESEHNHRICKISIDDMTNSRWERFAAAMQKPFPELTHLEVWVDGDVVRVLPDSFLGGSAPRLRTLNLSRIPFPSMPRLLSSANGLVTLDLWEIPHSGYFSPYAMATALAVMTRLQTLHLLFLSPLSRPDPASRPPPPPTRFVLPALTKLTFEGVHEYLEDLLARIDAPRLGYLFVTFFMDLNFYVPQLHRLIGHTEEFKTFDYGDVSFCNSTILLTLYPRPGALNRIRQLELEIKCSELDEQLSSLVQVCSPSFPLISTLEGLEIRGYGYYSAPDWQDDMENAQWLELLNLFPALEDLYVTDEIAPRVCGALQGLSGERATEVLPALRYLFVDVDKVQSESIRRSMMPFLVIRLLSGHPLVFDRWGG